MGQRVIDKLSGEQFLVRTTAQGHDQKRDRSLGGLDYHRPTRESGQRPAAGSENAGKPGTRLAFSRDFRTGFTGSTARCGPKMLPDRYRSNSMATRSVTGRDWQARI